jgi:hypothetical protein
MEGSPADSLDDETALKLPDLLTRLRPGGCSTSLDHGVVIELLGICGNVLQAHGVRGFENGFPTSHFGELCLDPSVILERCRGESGPCFIRGQLESIRQAQEVVLAQNPSISAEAKGTLSCLTTIVTGSFALTIFGEEPSDMGAWGKDRVETLTLDGQEFELSGEEVRMICCAAAIGGRFRTSMAAERIITSSRVIRRKTPEAGRSIPISEVCYPEGSINPLDRSSVCCA